MAHVGWGCGEAVGTQCSKAARAAAVHACQLFNPCHALPGAISGRQTVEACVTLPRSHHWQGLLGQAGAVWQRPLDPLTLLGQDTKPPPHCDFLPPICCAAPHELAPYLSLLATDGRLVMVGLSPEPLPLAPFAVAARECSGQQEQAGGGSCASGLLSSVGAC